jgi:hypothetical protein
MLALHSLATKGSMFSSALNPQLLGAAKHNGDGSSLNESFKPDRGEMTQFQDCPFTFTLDVER